jgi:protein-S-isoprenylcysteine O-methyltransferase Ste14
MNIPPFVLSPVVVGSIGVCGFGAVLLYDYLQLLQTKRFLSVTSIIGAVSVLLATGGLFLIEPIRPMPVLISVPISTGVGMSVALLIRSVYWEIPHSKIEASFHDESRRTVIRTGSYRWSRHPGFLWYVALVVFIGLRMNHRTVWTVGGVFVLADLIVVLIEDAVIFPRLFRDYADYKEEVPMLIPGFRFRRKNT